MNRPATGSRGFTLVELLVALFITAILFAMGYGSLSQALTSRKEVDEQQTRLNNVQQALRIMEQDFELMQPRPVRDLLGSQYLNPLVVNQNNAATGAGSSGASPTSGTSAGTGATTSSNASADTCPGSGIGIGTDNVSTSSSNSATVLNALTAQGLAILTFTRGGWANPAGLPRTELQRVSYVQRADKLVRQHLLELDTTGAVNVQERELLDNCLLYTSPSPRDS